MTAVPATTTTATATPAASCSTCASGALPAIKLKYFDKSTRGRADIILAVLEGAGATYTYEEVTIKAWMEDRRSPTGQLPMVTFGDKPMSESASISRFIAHKFNLAGTNEWESFLCDSAVDAVIDLREGRIRAFLADSAAKTDTNLKEFVAKGCRGQLGVLDKLLAKADKGFFVGGKLSWADFAAYSEFRLSPTASEFANIKKFMETMSQHPNMKTFVSKYPTPTR